MAETKKEGEQPKDKDLKGLIKIQNEYDFFKLTLSFEADLRKVDKSKIFNELGNLVFNALKGKTLRTHQEILDNLIDLPNVVWIEVKGTHGAMIWRK